MGFRFRRTLRLFPGVRLNFSKSGVSTSIGRPGATLNLGPRGPKYTVGVPGTGLSYSQRLFRRTPAPLPGGPVSSEPQSSFRWGTAAAIIVLFMMGLLIVSALDAPSEQAAPTVSRESKVVPKTVRVTASALRCRTDPSTAASVLQVLPRGTDVELVGTYDSWSRVVLEGRDCWVASRYLD